MMEAIQSAAPAWNILVVDHEATTRGLVASLLEEQGYRVNTAKGELEALDQLRADAFALALMNLALSEMESPAFLQRLRELGSDTEVIVIADQAQSGQATEAMRAGAYDYLLQPINKEELLLRVKKCLEKQLLDREKKRLSAKISLMELSRVLTSNLDLAFLYPQVIEQVMRAFAANSGSLMLLDEASQRFTIVAQQGLQDVAPGTQVGLDETMAGYVVRRGEPLLLLEGLENTPFAGQAQRPIRSALSVPLRVREKIIGVLNVNRELGHPNYAAEDTQLLSVYGTQTAIALENARLYEHTKQDADALDVIKNKVNCMHDQIPRIETRPSQVSCADWINPQRVQSAVACVC